MHYKINVQIDEDFTGEVEAKVIRAAARAALEHEAAPVPGELTIAATSDEALRRLSRDFLSEDRPTDVLSFASAERDPETGARYFGDIAVSFPAAHAQATAGGHSVAAELQLLTVHGVLHLLGHDHAQPDEQTRMWAAQAEILRKLKSSISGPADTQEGHA